MENIVVSLNADRGFDLAGNTYRNLSPKEFLLLSLGLCAAKTALALFDKMQLHVVALEVETSATLSGEAAAPETVFTSFHQQFRVGCPDPAGHGLALHALRLTHDKYCNVGRMLNRIAPLSYQAAINGHPVETEKE